MAEETVFALFHPSRHGGVVIAALRAVSRPWVGWGIELGGCAGDTVSFSVAAGWRPWSGRRVVLCRCGGDAVNG